MDRRHAKRPFDQTRSHERSAVAAYAKQKGWQIGRRNLLVEGTTDVAYFELASSLFEEDCGQALIDDQFRVVASGLLDEGGVRGVIREMVSLHGRAEQDLSLPKAERIRMLPVFDDDDAGRRCFKKVTDNDFPFEAYRDVFLLKRAYPSRKLGSPGFVDAVKQANNQWPDLDCEIEDLLGRDLLDGFCYDNSDALKSKPTHKGPAHHYDFKGHRKGDLLKFTSEIAGLADVIDVVRTLQYFRALFDLPVGPHLTA